MLSKFTFPSKNIELSYFKNGVDIGMAARTNTSIDEFDTESGHLMRQSVQKLEKNLNLSAKIGFSKYRYAKKGLLTEPDSMNRVWVYSVYPNIIYQRNKENIQFVVANSGSIRDHMFEGVVVNDDVNTIMPFPNTLFVFRGLEG